jgi:hypothetical protein
MVIFNRGSLSAFIPVLKGRVFSELSDKRGLLAQCKS